MQTSHMHSRAFSGASQQGQAMELAPANVIHMDLDSSFKSNLFWQLVEHSQKSVPHAYIPFVHTERKEANINMVATALVDRLEPVALKA